MENYYDILGIQKDAAQKDIKIAYAKMVRKYPPEKCPEEFKKIREAYQTLGDEKLRREYDDIVDNRENIDEHMRLGNEAMEKEDYKTAIREFKKVLITAPSLSSAKNMLGLALLYNDEVDNAIIQFEKLVRDYPDNSIFINNLGVAYRKKGSYEFAESMLKRAHELDRLDTNIIMELSGVYRDQKQYDKAIEMLQSVINEAKTDKFQNFIYYFEMVIIYILSNNIDKAEDVINKIESMISDDPEERSYIAWKFGKLAYEFYQIKVYNIAERISKRAREIDPSNEAIQNLHKDSKELNEMYTLFNKLSNDERVLPQLRGPIYYYLYADNYDEEELKENYDQNIAAIQSYVDGAPGELLESLSILKKEYHKLYICKKELYDDVYRLAKENKAINDEWIKLKEDKLITGSLVRLIALWISNGYSDEERNSYFNDIINEMKQENPRSLINALYRIRSSYPVLYELNPKFLKDIEDALKKDMGSGYVGNNNTSTSSTRGRQTSSANNKTTNNSTSSSSSSSNAGCIVIIICAVIGALIIPGAGFFIGAGIGYLISKKLKTL